MPTIQEPLRPTPATKEEARTRRDLLRDKLARQQMLLKEHKLPVLVLLEGWGAAGKGSLINRLIHSLDPRFYSVEAMEVPPTAEERRHPFLYRYVKVLPEAGHISLLDSGWMNQVVQERLAGGSERQYARQVDSIRRFERQLHDNGYLVVKFFLQIGQKEQRRRLRKLEKREETAWRVSEYDRWQNRRYDHCLAVFDQYLQDTDDTYAPWYILDGADKITVELEALELLTTAIDTALQNNSLAVPLLPNPFPLRPMPALSQVDLDKSLTEEEYRRRLKAGQKRLRELHNLLYQRQAPVVILYEGWDAAGKGGNIRRITDALDPRGYEVFPIASPEPHEKNRHYLWRFWVRLPKAGHVAIFDRSWYGRVMVERIEGFCSQNDWQRAYHEINEFERELVDWGAVVLKFWIHIDQETQLARFTQRQQTPEKQWKITDEDWRNREKWPAYEQAVDEMLQKTSTAFAPWHIIEGNDKRYARIKAMETLITALEERLDL